ncbi:hypothetical protein CLHUN_40300 [Ruminiclostridium hungatei]|uniref:Uncharacterized protein n=1 Tax=Ruminiclostridium hungatei TaxID=48256 RepID=A0A1V4SE76_RUMHU|nr:hypothetical protein [Ruminiclostridium hungatei]OPX42124.1 hypothetical protein CLHUN_40300 [Ruminiclostridium hungatei]
MRIRKNLIVVLMVSMLLVLMSQNCFAAGSAAVDNGSGAISITGPGDKIVITNPEIVPGRVIVAIKLGYENEILNDKTLAELGVVSYVNLYRNPEQIENFLGHSTWLLKLKDNSVKGVSVAITKLKKYSCVVYAEPDYIAHIN